MTSLFRTISRRRTLFSVCVFSLFLNSSCINNKLTKHLEDHTVQQQKSSKTLKELTFPTQGEKLDWATAKDLLFERNIQYKQSLRSIKQTKKQRRDQWREYLPRIFAIARVDAAINRIAQISSDDLQLGLTSSLNLPNPINYYVQAYGLALQELQSTLNLELQRRNLTLQLYRTFNRYKSLVEQEEKLSAQQENLLSLSPESLAPQIRALKKQQAQLRVSKERQRLALNNLFNTPGKNWILTGQPPKNSYTEKFEELDLYHNFGQLALKLQTVEIEANTLSLWNVKFSRWPTIALDLNTPQLSVTNTTENLDFKAEDFQLFTGLSKSIKLDDIFEKRQLRNAEFRSKVTRDALMRRVESEISQLEINKLTYRKLLFEKRQLQNALQALNTEKHQASIAGISSELKSFKNLNNQLKNIDRHLTQLDLQFWIWDDQYWSQH